MKKLNKETVQLMFPTMYNCSYSIALNRFNSTTYLHETKTTYAFDTQMINLGHVVF